jgi:hypothetical protein
MRGIIRIHEILRFSLSCHGLNKTIMKYERHLPQFYYESAKFIRVTYRVTLSNLRQCERSQNQTSFNEVLKTYVMMPSD